MGAELLGGLRLWDWMLMPSAMDVLAETQPGPRISISKVVCGSVHLQVQYSLLTFDSQ